MPPVPDPDQPLVVPGSTAGSASAPQRGGSTVHCAPNPHSPAGATGPAISATSYPSGNSPRTRSILAGLTCADAAVCVDVPPGAGAEDAPQAAARSATAAHIARTRC